MTSDTAATSSASVPMWRRGVRALLPVATGALVVRLLRPVWDPLRLAVLAVCVVAVVAALLLELTPSARCRKVAQREATLT
ncbi:hypothetical protein [Candidatus Poriferisodalis sp.]|uniref:hypothetical protein n=1 Tax=Candidatus Poriferisodalis sp. TaxID=3101277 RepID=UPI003B58DC1F